MRRWERVSTVSIKEKHLDERAETSFFVLSALRVYTQRISCVVFPSLGDEQQMDQEPFIKHSVLPSSLAAVERKNNIIKPS